MENSRRASWLQRTGRRRWGEPLMALTGTRCRGAACTIWRLPRGFNEPTSTVSALAPLTFKSVFTKSWGN